MGFLVAVEMEEGVNMETVKNRLAEELIWMEGIGKVVVDLLGEISCYEEPEIVEIKES